MTHRPRTTRRNSPASANPGRGLGRPAHGIRGTHQHTEFRSQLEIRFVKQAEAHGLTWFYEPERLGELRYLLDFFLPACKAWVEVKGVLSSRDHEALREVAALVDKQYHHALYMFTDENAYRVCEEGFIKITQEQFWRELLARRDAKPVPDACDAPDPATVWDAPQENAHAG